ncbi:hypothetical protein N9H63_00940 [bacterium]|nr:hypothetical protein [bacterium]
MAYKNKNGESEYLFGWLEAKPGSKEFKPTTGGNSEWAKTKREAIAKVNRRCKEFEKENPNYVQLRVNPETCRRAKTRQEARDFDYGLYLMTI